MNKLLIAAILWIGMLQPGWALTVEERLLAGLQSQGYTVIEKGYTFLGRLRIVAENDEFHREIVVNPGTGEILRDYAVYLTDMAQNQQPRAAPAPASHDSGGSANQVASSAPAKASKSHGSGPGTGTAGVAASALTPGSSTLGISNLQVDTTPNGTDSLLDNTLLPMSTGTP